MGNPGQRSKWKNLALWLLYALYSSVAFPTEKIRLVNGTAATVGKKLFTIQDAYFYRALKRFREGEATALLEETGETLRRTVQKIVFEEMVFSEMKGFKFEGGRRSDVEKAIQLQRKKGHEGQWKFLLSYFGKSENSVVDRLYQSVQVENFLDRKVETLTPVITEAEAERYYKQNPARFSSSTFDKLKPSIILFLKKERLSRALEEWIHALKDKYGVINYLGN